MTLSPEWAIIQKPITTTSTDTNLLLCNISSNQCSPLSSVEPSGGLVLIGASVVYVDGGKLINYNPFTNQSISLHSKLGHFTKVEQLLDKYFVGYTNDHSAHLLTLDDKLATRSSTNQQVLTNKPHPDSMQPFTNHHHHNLAVNPASLYWLLRLNSYQPLVLDRNFTG